VKNPLQLEGKTILVTGASSGIGRATAVLLSELGARMALVARNEDKLRETLGSLQAGTHWVEAFDLADLDRIPQWFSALIDKTGPLDGLVHCAGMSSLMPLRMVTTQHLETMMRVNFYAAVSLCREFSRKPMHGPSSSIVLVASVAGLLGVTARAAYSSSKGALIAFARSAAIELAKQKIRVNCVAPAFVQTEMYDASLKALTREQLNALIDSTHPLGLGAPIDVAHAIGFLLAETGRWITGSVLAVDGGYSAQ
jgi:NAD(P)-dependent dehydrogenase (short-subunit alcohol dehydrogenase family)